VHDGSVQPRPSLSRIQIGREVVVRGRERSHGGGGAQRLCGRCEEASLDGGLARSMTVAAWLRLRFVRTSPSIEGSWGGGGTDSGRRGRLDRGWWVGLERVVLHVGGTVLLLRCHHEEE
jgi:hypothetical protein